MILAYLFSSKELKILAERDRSHPLELKPDILLTALLGAGMPGGAGPRPEERKDIEFEMRRLLVACITDLACPSNHHKKITIIFGPLNSFANAQ